MALLNVIILEDMRAIYCTVDLLRTYAPCLNASEQAKELQIKNVNYIVKANEIIIVDEFTGRTMPGRRWSDGLHQVCRGFKFHVWMVVCVT